MSSLGASILSVNMEIIEVKTKQDWQLFHRVPQRVYQQDPNWILPLEADIESIFDVSKNSLFNNGEAKCFVLLEKHQPYGRIAAFIDFKSQSNQIYKQGGIGFFECIENHDYARSLFEVAEAYLQTQGIELIDAMINFGSRDKYWGLLVRGFQPPLFQENYHPPYYQKLLLDNNYQPYEQILTYAGDTQDMPFKRLRAISQRLQQRQPMYVKGFSFDEQERFIKDFCEICNAAFAHNSMSPEQVEQMLDRGKDIIDPQLMCIGYYQDKPAGYIVLYPDINPLLKNVKGKLNLWNIPVFLFKKQFTSTFAAKGISIGIHPDYQAQGIVALLIDFLCSERNIKRYPQIYLAGISTQNHQIRSIYNKLNLDIARVHCTYRKALREDIPIEPLEFIDFEAKS